MFNHEEAQYLQLMRKILAEGNYREGRNGNTYSLFGEQMKFDLRAGFPLLTTKRLNYKSIIVELLWFLRGESNIKYLHDHDVHIWDQWADKEGELGPVYGVQWRNWGGYIGPTMKPVAGIDQIKKVIEGLKADPYGRRHVVTAWNPDEIDIMGLPPCHMFFQFHVAGNRLSCHMYQRSADWFVGVPFNIASYALLTHLVARECGFEVGTFVHSFGDLHLYANHREQAMLQLSRTPTQFPTLVLPPWTKDKTIFDLTPDDIEIAGYVAASHIKAEVSA